MEYYIYRTINLINNKKYIGKHKGLINDDYLGSGILITKAIEKYGKENFKKEILYISKNEEENNRMEKYYINKYNAVESDEYYNIADGGQGGYVTAGYTKKQRKDTNKKISLALKRCPPNLNKKISEDTKKKLREASLRYWTEEKRKERSIQYSGKGNPMYGKHHTKKTIEKIKKNTDFISYRTEEYKKKMSEATKGKKNGNYGNKDEKAKNGKQVMMYNKDYKLLKTFNTKKMVLEFLGISSHDGLNKAIKNNTLYKGYYWKQQS